MQTIKSIILGALVFFASGTAQSNAEFYELSFENQDNETVEFSQYKGKAVLLNFWATWCPPCIREMPSMQRLKEHFSEQPFEIIALNAGESTTTVSSFLLEFDTDITFTILMDKKNLSFSKFSIRGLPMSLLIDKDGNLIETILGERDWDSPEAISKIEHLIRE